MGEVVQLWCFPVKSMQGSPVDVVELTASGVAGDRLWGVLDPAAGRVLSAKRWPKLLQLVAAADPVRVTFPDGATHEAGDPALDAALSTFLDHDVRLGQPPPGDGLPYELPTEAWNVDSPLWEFPGPPGGPFVDLAAAHVLTTASLRAAEALRPETAWDVRRFRPTALVDSEAEGFVEDAWVGARVALGEVEVDPFMPTVRCAMTTREQPGLPKDADVARTLRDQHGLNLGVYCAVSTPGTVRVGDPVSVAALGS